MTASIALGEIRRQPTIGKGGFGTVHLDPRDSSHCIKVLSTPVIGDQAEHLHRLVDIATWARPSELEYFTTRFAWPIELFGSAGAVEAFTMPLAPASTFFELTAAGKTSRQTLQLKYLMDDSYWQGRAITSAKPDLSYQDRLEVAIDCLDSLDLLHHHNLCFGDVSGNNIVARRDVRPGVFFFDADSIMAAGTPGAQPILTPDWDAPEGLDLMETDRSRFALLVLRLLLESPREYPSEASITRLPSGNGDVFGPTLLDCYRTGSIESFQQLSRLLREVRDGDRDAAALQYALDKGYARWMLRERDEARSAFERRLIKIAEAQIELENEIDEAVGAQYRRLIRRNKVGESPFTLDIRPRGDVIDHPKSTEQLRQLIYASEFEKITSTLALEGLAQLENDPWLPRVVQHALVHVPDPLLRIDVDPGSANISLAWPAAPYINSARIEVRTDAGSLALNLTRAANETSATRVVAAPGGVRGVVNVKMGIRSPNNLEVLRDTHHAQQFVVPPRPVPQQAAPGRYPLIPQAPLELFDPVEYAARMRALAIQQRKRRIQRAVAAVGAIAVLATGGWFSVTRFVLSDDRPKPFAGLDVVHAGSQLRATWLPNGPTIDEIVVDGSWDGSTWTPLTVASLDPENATVVVDESADSDYPYLRFQRLSKQKPKGSPVIWPTPLSSGLAAAPTLVETEDGVSGDWAPQTSDAARVPTAYVVRYTTQYPDIWYVLRTTKPRFRGSLPAVGTVVHIQVQAVFADGTLGVPVNSKPLTIERP